jgi:hypothetical protein
MKQLHVKVGASTNLIFAGYAIWFKSTLTGADIK